LCRLAREGVRGAPAGWQSLAPGARRWPEARWVDWPAGPRYARLRPTYALTDEPARVHSGGIAT